VSITGPAREPGRRLDWRDECEFTLGDVTFRAAPWERFESSASRFCLVKRPDLVDRYVSLLDELRPDAVFELGIFAGGSTAFMAELSQPSKLVAVDVSATRVHALDEYVSAHGLSERVKPYFGVDQGDANAMREILDRDFGDVPLDLVIDDASHDLALTRRSFNVLFPRLRHGGVFVIEDWSWAHMAFSAYRPDETPLTVFVFELVMACASMPGLIDEVTIDRDWALVRRGSLAVDADNFDLSACYSERGRELLPPTATVRSS
jgi:SAM-dependent methyltransferase